MNDARALAVDVLVRVGRDGAYANLALPAALARSNLSERDRGFVTELVYGTLRMQRACDWLVDRFVSKPPDLVVRTVLRVGAYQLAYMGTAPHAAVSETVAIAPSHARAFVNAVLRKVAAAPLDPPDDATRLSYPDWIVDRVVADLGRDDGIAALAHMNRAPRVHTRPDGYVQDEASGWVADLVDAARGTRVADLCAAPGGKATRIAAISGAFVAASDLRAARVRTMATNVAALAASHVHVLVADARRPPYRDESFERVLVDAPCSGLGVLRRRPDARWRVQEEDVPRLAALQAELVDAAVPLLASGGVLVYAVCTITRAETLGIDDHLARVHPDLEPLDQPGAPWRSRGRGGLLLPQDADTDGMFVLRLRRA